MTIREDKHWQRSCYLFLMLYFIIFTLGLTSLHLFAGITPTLDQFSEPKTPDSIRRDFEVMLGRPINISFYAEENELLKNIKISKYQCNIQGTYIYDCLLMVFKDLQTNQIILSKFYLPENMQMEVEPIYKSGVRPEDFTGILEGRYPNKKFSRGVRTYYKGKLTFKFKSEDNSEILTVFISTKTGRIVDELRSPKVHNLHAEVYPLWEETISDNYNRRDLMIKGRKGQATLKKLNDKFPVSESPIFTEVVGEYDSSLRTYSGENNGTPGAWNYNDLKRKIIELGDFLPIEPDGVYLDGEFVTVLEHPDSIQFANFQKTYFNRPVESYKPVLGQIDWNFQIQHSFMTQKLNPDENYVILDRVPNQTLSSLVNDPTDAIHVYHNITTFFENIVKLGYTDFSSENLKLMAFVHDPSKIWKDNAYYNGAVNFTTYSDDFPNWARHAPITWHELGHSIFDKIIGNGTYKKGRGINEGLSDFFSFFMYRYLGHETNEPGYKLNRIFSKAVFNVSNAPHEEGEAYGGSLREILEEKIKSDGTGAYPKMMDLVLSTMRFLRNSQNLSEQEFFHTMYWVDRNYLNGVRENGEFTPLIQKVLKSRNFFWKDSDQTSLSVSVNNQDVPLSGFGSASQPIDLQEDLSSSNYQAKVRIVPGKFLLKFPVTVKLVSPTVLYGDVQVTGPREITLKDLDDEATFNYKVTHRCTEYTGMFEGKETCKVGVRFVLSQANDDWHFAIRRIFYRITK